MVMNIGTLLSPLLSYLFRDAPPTDVQEPFFGLHA